MALVDLLSPDDMDDLLAIALHAAFSRRVVFTAVSISVNDGRDSASIALRANSTATIGGRFFANAITPDLNTK